MNEITLSAEIIKCENCGETGVVFKNGYPYPTPGVKVRCVKCKHVFRSFAHLMRIGHLSQEKLPKNAIFEVITEE